MRAFFFALVFALSVPAYPEVTNSRLATRTVAAAESVTAKKIRIELVQPAGRAPTAETEREQERRRSRLLRRLDKLGLLQSREVVIHADGSMTVIADADGLEQIRAEVSVAQATRVSISSTDSVSGQDAVHEDPG